jgi:plasmid stabilization system protein ParE
VIFLSYSRANVAAARRLARALQRAGERVWVDTRDLDLTGDLHHQIERAIRRSRAFVVLRTRAAARSAWVAWELKLARRMGKPIVMLAPA